MREGEVLAVKGLEKEYPGVRALKGVDLSFDRGEIHALVGENGAGKSTLIKILAGVVKADGGSFFFDGVEKSITSSKDATANGMSFIHQELNLVSYFNAMENIFLGHAYPHHHGLFIDWKQLRARTRTILEQLQIDLPVDKPVMYLSAVERAMVAIARAFAVSATIYFMDEPATALTDIEKEKLFSVVRTLKAQGKTVVYVTHNLDDILTLTDRLTVMRDGRVVHQGPTAAMTKDNLISTMIGKPLHAAFPTRKRNIREVVLEVKDLANDALGHISFTLRRGEILGIGGLVGSGRTELLETLYGVRPVKGGGMHLLGRPYRPLGPHDAIASNVVLVPEERRRSGLVLSRSIRENITVMSLRQISRSGFLDHRRIDEESKAAGKRVRLKTSSYASHVSTLSGGNQQKVVFAKSVLTEPVVLMLDEPTKGVDVGSRFEIYSVVGELAARGAAILIVSSDFNEILGLADRIVFIKDGSLTSERPNEGIDQETYLHYCYGRT